MALEEVIEEKVSAAERRIAGVRLLTTVAATVLFPFMDPARTIPWLAYSVIAVVWLYSGWVLLARPYRRYPAARLARSTAVADAVVIFAFVFATGGYDSPFFVLLYLSAVAFGLRYPPAVAYGGGVLYALSYAALVFATGGLGGHEFDVAVRSTLIVVAAALGNAASREILVQATGRHLLAQARRDLEAEVAKRTTELERLNLQLKEAVAARDTFLSVASHELRTPLNAMRLASQLLVEQSGREVPSPEGIHKRTEAVDRQGRRLEALVDALLDVSRITSGGLALDEEECDLAGSARGVAAEFEPLARSAGCELRVRAESPVPGYWDRLRLEQVVSNLLSNAIKYGAGKPVDLTVEGDAQTAYLAVRDRGPGIGPEDQERVFQRFERLVSERSFGGLGLGLWIVREIVERMGGEVGIESHPTGGALFRVALPRGPRERAVMQQGDRDSAELDPPHRG